MESCVSIGGGRAFCRMVSLTHRLTRSYHTTDKTEAKDLGGSSPVQEDGNREKGW
jgi:hypothetical protein